MILYSIILFAVAIPMIFISIAIYRGKTNLIHDYHQTKVTDSAAYGKAFGKAMFIIPLSMILSAAVGLLGDSDAVAMGATAVLLAGLFVGTVCIVIVQSKYNKGVF